MHCYNGPAENTPWADTLREQPDWVVFENAYAFYTHTVQALGAALTDGRALTGLTFPQGQNILGISRQAGIHTTWLSNQMHFGAWDNPISALAHMADNVQFTAKAHSFQLSAPLPDSVLLPLIEQALDKADPQKNSFLAIHLMGSHSPYDRRYPENFEPVPMYEKKHLGSLAEKIRHKRYQEYLTSIKYTDEILKNIHHTVARQADRPVFLLYFADHGEDIFVRGGGHDFSNFTWTMARIPMFLWFSQAYQEKYPERIRSALANREKIFTNDLIYDLYLGLAGIQTPSRLAEYDISSEEYRLILDEAAISDGKQPKTDPGLIAARNFGLERPPILAAHRTNSLFKLKQAQGAGLRCFEVDIMYEELEGRATLQVGHDPGSMAALDFSEYLEQLAKGFDFLWMDMKNLTERNNSAALALLDGLDAQYGLRSKCLLKTSNPAAGRILADAGWNTSYYLYWSALAEAWGAGEEEKLRALSAGIAASIEQSGLGGVSYDLKADEAVKKYVLPLLPPKTKLYAWNSGWSFFDPDLPDKIRQYEHLTCLLVSLPSPYGI